MNSLRWSLLLALPAALFVLGGCSAADHPASDQVDTAASTMPAIDLTSVPALGTTADLVGRVYNLSSVTRYRVVVYILVPGWGWAVKPTLAEPVTTLKPDRTFRCDVTTGGDDAQATRLAAFLIPASYSPPALSRAATLPTALYSNAVADVLWERSPMANWRVLTFSGYEWAVKASPDLMGPGPNYFSDSSLSVWVDKQGRLHLKSRPLGGVWQCAEVICQSHLGYGHYTWTLDSSVDAFDKNVVLGLFTWSDQEAYAHRELDFEVGRFGNAATPNSSYSVQPYDLAGHHHPFATPAGGTTHQFLWRPSTVAFKSVRGAQISTTDPAKIIQTWNYTQAGVPVTGDERVHMNLWLFDDPATLSTTGEPPANGKSVEVIARRFGFTR